MNNTEKCSRLICDIPTEAHSEIKVECAKQRISMSDMMKRAVRDYLGLDLTDAELGIQE